MNSWSFDRWCIRFHFKHIFNRIDHWNLVKYPKQQLISSQKLEQKCVITISEFARFWKQICKLYFCRGSFPTICKACDQYNTVKSRRCCHIFGHKEKWPKEKKKQWPPLFRQRDPQKKSFFLSIKFFTSINL